MNPKRLCLVLSSLLVVAACGGSGEERSRNVEAPAGSIESPTTSVAESTTTTSSTTTTTPTVPSSSTTAAPTSGSTTSTTEAPSPLPPGLVTFAWFPATGALEERIGLLVGQDLAKPFNGTVEVKQTGESTILTSTKLEVDGPNSPRDGGTKTFTVPKSIITRSLRFTVSFTSTDSNYPSYVGTNFAVECGTGSYNAIDGMVPCTPASAGKIVPFRRSREALPCPPGLYAPETGSIACIRAEPGFFVAGPGASKQMAAPAGSFVADAGQRRALLCPQGTFQRETGRTSCVAASPGSFVAEEGQTTAELCPSGAYQPEFGKSSCIEVPELFPNSG